MTRTPSPEAMEKGQCGIGLMLGTTTYFCIREHPHDGEHRGEILFQDIKAALDAERAEAIEEFGPCCCWLECPTHGLYETQLEERREATGKEKGDVR